MYFWRKQEENNTIYPKNSMALKQKNTMPE